MKLVKMKKLMKQASMSLQKNDRTGRKDEGITISAEENMEIDRIVRALWKFLMKLVIDEKAHEASILVTSKKRA